MSDALLSSAPLNLPPPLARRVHTALRPVVYAAVLCGAVTMALVWNIATRFELAAVACEMAVLLLLPPLLERGRVEAAAWLVNVSLLAANSVVVLAYGTMRSLGSLGFAFVVVIAAIFLRRRGFLLSLVATWIVVAALVYVELARPVPVPLRPMSWQYGVLFNSALLFVGLVTSYARSIAVSAVASQHAQFTERVRMEDETRRMEERLRLSMEATRQGWFDLDLRTGDVEASTHFARLLGVPGGSIMPGMTRDRWIDAIHRDDRDGVLHVFDECLRTGETRQMEYRLLGLDGTFRWIRSIAKVVQWDERGQPVRMTGTHADISEQMATTLALKENERRYRTLVELSPVGVIVQCDDLVRYANPSALGMLGITHTDALVGRPLTAYVSAESAESLATLCAKALRGQSPPDPVEHRLLRADGTPFDASVQCARVFLEGRASVQLSVADVSARKRSEDARLQSRQLEALGTLAGGIAHDFNNILLAIRGNAELVAADPALSSPSSEYLHEILTAGQRASELVRRITAFGSPRPPHRDVIALPAIVHEALQLLRPTIPAGIALEVSVQGEAPAILADGGQIHEALVNLTTNAVYAIGSGRVGRIEFLVDGVNLDAEAVADLGVPAGRYTRLAVRDNGIGMDAATQARVFDAFYTTKPVGEGTGLGLSMVYGTMRSHGGAVSVESAPGKGATFQLFFPSSTHRPTPTSSMPVPAPSPIPYRVLFVDDEPQLVRLAERVLMRHGYDVVTFNDPIAALTAFTTAPASFDVVVTDLSMPGMSGLELARAIRRIRTDLPIVMATGYADGTDEAEANAAGITHVSVKASMSHQLPVLLAKAFARRDGR